MELAGPDAVSLPNCRNHPFAGTEYRQRAANRISQRQTGPHLRSPAFRANAQGGERYPKHGPHPSDRTYSPNRRGPGRIGPADIRCPRSRSHPANQIAELPHSPETGASGRDHRNRKGKKQGTGLRNGPCLASFFADRLQSVPGCRAITSPA